MSMQCTYKTITGQYISYEMVHTYKLYTEQCPKYKVNVSRSLTVGARHPDTHYKYNIYIYTQRLDRMTKHKNKDRNTTKTQMQAADNTLYTDRLYHIINRDRDAFPLWATSHICSATSEVMLPRSENRKAMSKDVYMFRGPCPRRSNSRNLGNNRCRAFLCWACKLYVRRGQDHDFLHSRRGCMWIGWFLFFIFGCHSWNTFIWKKIRVRLLIISKRSDLPKFSEQHQEQPMLHIRIYIVLYTYVWIIVLVNVVCNIVIVYLDRIDYQLGWVTAINLVWNNRWQIWTVQGAFVVEIKLCKMHY